MGYYTRVISPSMDRVEVKLIQEYLEKEGLLSSCEIESDDPDNWNQMVLCDKDGSEIAEIERNVIEEGSLGEEEIEEFIEEIEELKPDSAVQWLKKYLGNAKCIYCFQHLHGSESDQGFELLSSVKEIIWRQATGIIQADHEGFTNEQGYHILWQFSETVEGHCNMGVIEDGNWLHFKMDLGNKEHRKAFMEGKVPCGEMYKNSFDVK